MMSARDPASDDPRKGASFILRMLYLQRDGASIARIISRHSTCEYMRVHGSSPQIKV